ncbi:MAG: hypothetical protein F7C37_06210 [Desulfurococcales archaeon]|nr:hypothetical protein [Desulfurococcales archaeon]
MALSVSFLSRKIWRKSGKYVIPLPEEYAGLFGHGQVVEVELRLSSGEVYRLRGVVKKYRSGVFVKLPPEARAVWSERGLRVRVLA